MKLTKAKLQEMVEEELGSLREIGWDGKPDDDPIRWAEQNMSKKWLKWARERNFQKEAEKALAASINRSAAITKHALKWKAYPKTNRMLEKERLRRSGIVEEVQSLKDDLAEAVLEDIHTEEGFNRFIDLVGQVARTTARAAESMSRLDPGITKYERTQSGIRRFGPKANRRRE